MSRWFRWYEGTCEDGKFRVVARNASVTVATVMGVWAALLEDASNDEHRGVASRGEDFYAAILDLPATELQRILEEMDGIGLVSAGHGNITITKWKERQFETDKIDGTNADRQRRWREKRKSNGSVTDSNGIITEEKRPETETETERKKDAPTAPPDQQKDYYVRVRQVLGARAGGLGAKLLAAKGKNIPLARSALERASIAANPTEYICKIISNQAQEDRSYVDPRL